MNAGEAVRANCAVRKYGDDPRPDGVVHAILHGGRRARSARNDQP